MLEPNIKRSQGTLRDLQLLRWIGFVRYGLADLAELRDAGALSTEDYDAVQPAYAFLLWLRNDMHFHAGQASDVLSRGEQLRMAENKYKEPSEGLLPVELFMRDYFRHTSRVSHVATKFLANATTRQWLDVALTHALAIALSRTIWSGRWA